ncbi:MAG: inositol oxygenase [Acidobacteria bacterium]|nr:inositol oxygenase [Acidobacteriota bacterium]
MSGPLQSLGEWDDHVAGRYQPGKGEDEFRQYDEASPPVVREFYRLNHTRQTREFVLSKKREYAGLQRGEMGIWEAMERLNSLVDDSDPDTDLSQIEHNLQTAEAIRRDGHPRWFVLTGLIHDLGKVLCLYGEPQWAVVGDTFPVGCRYSGKIVFHEYFRDNPDSRVPEYQTPLGVYEPNCGLDHVDLSWGHDEYLYHVVKDYLPEPALYMIRYHSFYPGHREGEYDYLMTDRDREMFTWVRKFNPYDLYSKGDTRPRLEDVRPYYEELVAEYFPGQLRW